MVRLWESLDQDYKNFLKNLITPDEYETSSVTERIQLRDQFRKELEQSRKEARNETVAEVTISPSQTYSSSIKTELGDTDISEDDCSRRNEENNKPAANAIVAPPPPCNIKAEECDPCDAGDTCNEDIDNIVMEDIHGGNEENVKIKTEDMEDPPPKKRRKFNSALKCDPYDAGDNCNEDIDNIVKEDIHGGNEENVKIKTEDIEDPPPKKRSEFNSALKCKEEEDNGPSMDCNVGSEEMQQERGELSEIDRSASSKDPNQIKVKRELEDCEAGNTNARYGDKTLLCRRGIARILGGNHLDPFFGPTKKTWGGVLPEDYPIPKMGIKKNANGRDEPDWPALTCCAYNDLWENDLWKDSAPKYAGQPTATVKYVPKIMKTRCIALPIFVRRCLPMGKFLGWEYIGHYRRIPNEGIGLYESAKNYSKASKNKIAEKYHKSSQASGDTHGKRRLNSWRKCLIDAIATGEENETKETKSLATRALELGFKPGMTNEALCHLLVELDEFHRPESIEFVEYDEHFYEYIKEARTERNAKGRLVKKDRGEPAKASDWYKSVNERNLCTYNLRSTRSEEMQQRRGELSEIDRSASSKDPNQIKVKRELEDCAAGNTHARYGDKSLLCGRGIERILGGNHRHIFFGPTKNTWGGLLPEDYPIPKMGIKKNGNGKDEPDWHALTCCAYNDLWENSAPKYAGQPTAAVTYVPEIMKTRRIALPIFVKRCGGGKFLGWEYVGHYRRIPNEGNKIYKRAKNYTKASKNKIAKKYHKSCQAGGDTHDKQILKSWRKFLTNAIATGEENETKKTKSLATRALELGFKPGMTNEALCHLLVELDEFHRPESIEFVEYDEHFYEYIKEARTERTAKGTLVEKDGGEPSKASDWYNLAKKHNLWT